MKGSFSEMMNEERMAEDLNRMRGNFSLSEMEEDELEINNHAWEVGSIRGKTCVVGKLIADHLVSKETIRTTLLRGWKPSGTPSFKVLGDNLFLVDFVDEKDKKRVLEGRPWVFEGNLFAVEDYDGLTIPAKIPFDKETFWVRMLNLPLACMSLNVGHQIGSAMGHVEEVDVDEGGMGWGEYLRVKITLDLQKPLMRGRILKINGSRVLISFQYERLPKICFSCGVIKHGKMGCPERNNGRKQHAPTEFGPWLRPPSPKRVFRGRFGQGTEKRDPPQQQREKMGGFGQQGYGRRSSPGNQRPPYRSHEGGGSQPGQAERGEQSNMEGDTNNKNFPCKANPMAQSGSEMGGMFNEDAAGNLDDANQGGAMGGNLNAANSGGDFAGDMSPKKYADTGDTLNGLNPGAKLYGLNPPEIAAEMEKGAHRGLYSAASNKFLDELIHKEEQSAGHVVENTDELYADGGHRGTKRTRNSGNSFFTMSEVEKRMRRALSTDVPNLRGASDETWRQGGRNKSSINTHGDNRGKSKICDFQEKGVEGRKVCRPKGKSGAGKKTENSGSGLAEAGHQPRRPQ